MSNEALPPGSRVGVFGGGQLGRMFCQAARRLGYETHVYTNHANSPAGQVADHEHVGSYTDLNRVAEFARRIEAATLEFENLPSDAIAHAEQYTTVRPSHTVLRTAQHRLREKQFLNGCGAPVGPFAEVNSLEELRSAASEIGLPAVLKTSQMGYDGKGQYLLKSERQLEEAWQALGPGECLLEGFVEFSREVSVIVARGQDGQCAYYGPIENSHSNHILDVSVYPAPASTQGVEARAGEIAKLVAGSLDLVGLVCVEMFEMPDGQLLVNELAPRPHNSGHLTIEGCETSQFEQQARVLCGLPLGSVEVVRPSAMANLLGERWFTPEGSLREPNWERAEEQGAAVHLYGKDSPRPGRKMGHLTATAETSESARDRVVQAREELAVCD